MAFSPDVKTITRNVYLQKKLSVTCDFLEKEKNHFKKRYEEKQRECLSTLERLRSDSKRFGIPMQPAYSRPFTSSTPGIRSRSQSVSVSTNGHFRTYRPRSSSQSEFRPKNEYVKDMKVYTFHRLESDSPDTEAFTVYCHSPTRRTSIGTPVSQINNLVPSALSNYNSDIKWNDVKTISEYMNRSERRNSTIDVRTPIVLADVGRLRPCDVKPRSMSYSGPSRATQMASCEPLTRQRSATVSSPYIYTRGRRIGVMHSKEENPDESANSSPPTSSPQPSPPSPDPEPPSSLQSPNERETSLHSSNAEIPNSCNSEESRDPCSPPSESVNVMDMNKSIKESTESQANLSPLIHNNRLGQSLNKRFNRRVSAPEVKPNSRGRIARSSHEARMQRRLSQGRPASRWIEEEAGSDNSDSEDFDQKDYDADAYVLKQVSSFMSSLKCSDALEDRVTSYLTTLGKVDSLNRTTADTSAANLEVLPSVVRRRKQDGASDIPVEKKEVEKPLTNRRLADMLKRPQMQLQMLLNKIRDANRAAERADRMRPKVKPKCTF